MIRASDLSANDLQFLWMMRGASVTGGSLTLPSGLRVDAATWARLLREAEAMDR